LEKAALSSDFKVRTMNPSDLPLVKEIVDLSFSRVTGFFAKHSIKDEEGNVIVNETGGNILGFAKLIEFNVGGGKYGCILWIGVHPQFRRKGVASALTSEGIRILKNDGVKAVFASTQRRNAGALKVLQLEGFRKMGFLDLRRLLSWRVLVLYREIWLAPGEVVFMHP
jgi:ribosomal protein S18 acetylase RimI-like enzyme